MHLVCGISKTLIKKNQSIRVFFIESKKRELFPFMNHMPTACNENFGLLSVPFKAKVIEDEYQEIIKFEKDNKESVHKLLLLDYLNKYSLSKKEIKEKGLLNHWAKKHDFQDLNSLGAVWERVAESALFVRDGDFVSAMVVHESVYKAMLEHGGIKAAIERVKQGFKTEDYKTIKEKKLDWINRRKIELELQLGKTISVEKRELVLVDDDVIDYLLNDLKQYEGRYKENVIESLKKDIHESKGKMQNIKVLKDVLVDQDYIESEILDFKIDLFGHDELNIIKRSALAVNDDILLLKEILGHLTAKEQFKQSEWISCLEALVVQSFLTNNGMEYMPSRRRFLYEEIHNKSFFEEITSLSVFK